MTPNKISPPKIMEQFNYLKTNVNMDEGEAWNFVLNTWIVWKGGRPAYLMETSNFKNPTLFTAVLRQIVKDDPIVGMVSDASATIDYPRWLFYNKQKALASDVEKVRDGSDEMAIARLLQFGCMDPEFGDRQLIRTSYNLLISADEFPKNELMTFMCSEKTTQPSEDYLRRIATPLKQVLQTTFHNVDVRWKIRKNYPLKKLVILFSRYVKGDPAGNVVATPEGRKMFANILLDGEGFETLEKIFGDLEFPQYQRQIRVFGLAILALLVLKEGEMCDIENMTDQEYEDYTERIQLVEDTMFNQMPTK